MTTRLDTVRTYFIERFFEILTGDPLFAGLTEPEELFDEDGRFNVPATPAGFVRMPTLTALDARIEDATGEQREQLLRFRFLLETTIAELFGPLGYASTTAEDIRAVAERCAPVIRHPDAQTYWPVDVLRYLGFDDGVLGGRLHTPTGTRPIGANAFGALFDNPEVWRAEAPDDGAEGGRVPFTATIGVDAAVPPYPTSPLSAGFLNLPAGDARLTPGRLGPTLFSEVKAPQAASRVNRHYNETAARGGRFEELRNNRVHADPVAPVEFPVNGGEPLMFLYHAFYPADDGARRVGDGRGTNREFHHLAVGLLMSEFPEDDGNGNGNGGNGNGNGGNGNGGPHGGGRPSARNGGNRLSGLLFVSTTPRTATVIPLDHPALTFVDDSGESRRHGLHPVLWATVASPQGLQPTTAALDNSDLLESIADTTEQDPSDGPGFWIGLGSAVLLGAGAGFVVGGPIGALIGAVVGLLVFLLAWLLNNLFGGDKDRQEEWTEQEPWPGSDLRTEAYQSPQTQDIGPPGVVSETGGETPGRSYSLRNIPHFPADNLYGLAFSGADTFRIVDDADRDETLAWRAFTGGVGYQFARPLPGRADVSGTSLRNYFELFTRTYQDLEAARTQVVYFDA